MRYPDSIVLRSAAPAVSYSSTFSGMLSGLVDELSSFFVDSGDFAELFGSLNELGNF
jgi:hypothetical protein